MEELTPHGLFAPLGSPQESLPGALTFDPAVGGSLSLPLLQRDSDSFFGAWQPVYNDDAPLIGMAGENLYSLVDRTRTSIDLRPSGHSRVVASGKTILIDATEDMLTHDSYRAFQFGFQHAEQWTEAQTDELVIQAQVPDYLMPDPFNFSQQTPSNDPEKSTATVLSIRYRPSPEIGKDIVIARLATITVNTGSEMSLAEIRHLCGTLESLFTIILDVPAPINYVRLYSYPPSSIGTVFDAEMKSALGRGAAFHSARTFRTWDQVASFQDLGGSRSVAFWIGVATKYSRVVRALADDFEIPAGQRETKLLNAVRTAEAFFTVQNDFGGRTSGLAEEILICFAAEASPTLDGIIPCRDCWASLLIRLRHEIAHGDELSVQDPELITALSESLYLALVLALLKLCGLSQAGQDRLSEHRRVKSIGQTLTVICECS